MNSLPFWQAVLLLLLLAWPAYNLVLALLGSRPRPGPTPQVTKDPLEFWIVIPALNEETVIERTVTSALRQDPGDAVLRVLVVDDASDDATPAILARINDPRLTVLRREAPNARRGKGEALNAAFLHVRARAAVPGAADRTVLGIIDGDGCCSPGALQRIGELMGDPRVGAVQCRVRIHNRAKLLGLLQDIEFGCIADAQQSLRDRVGSVQLGGNGQFVRLSELARFGEKAWSSCLVEDLELGLRLHQAGTVIRYSDVTVTQQAVVDPTRLLRQRTRWAQGNLQAAQHLPGLVRSRQIGSLALLDCLQCLVIPWLTVPASILAIVLASAIVRAGVTGSTLGVLTADQSSLPLALSTWGAVVLLPGFTWGLVHRLRYGDEPAGRCLRAGAAYPVFLLLGVAATWRALFRLLSHRNKWTKTDRLAETSSGTIT